MTTETRSLPLRTREEYRYWKAYARHCARLRPTDPEDFDGARRCLRRVRGPEAAD